MKQKTRIALTIFILVLVFAVASVAKIKAGTGENGIGFLWGGGTEDDGVQTWDEKNTNVGWISMNSSNCDANNDGTNDKCDMNGDGVVDAPDFVAVANYGVNIPTDNTCIAFDPACQLSGYAWSENIGWISFNAADLSGCPNSACVAQRVGNTLTGWARIMGIKTELAVGNSGGWEGWISLNAPGRAIIVNDDNTLSGFAWNGESSGEGLGWIDFSRASIGGAKTILGQVTASPNLVASSSTPVTVTATVTGGTATGNMVYELDCKKDGSIEQIYPSSGDTTETSHIFADACTYTGSSTASVKITRDGVSISPVASVTFGCIDSVCDTTTYTCENTLKASGCSSSCSAANCKRPPSNNWIETPVQ